MDINKTEKDDTIESSLELGMVPPISNSSTTEVEAGGLTQVKANLCYTVSLGAARTTM